MRLGKKQVEQMAREVYQNLPRDRELKRKDIMAYMPEGLSYDQRDRIYFCVVQFMEK